MSAHSSHPGSALGRLVEDVRATLAEMPTAAWMSLSGDVLAAALSARTGDSCIELEWVSWRRPFSEGVERPRIAVTLRGWMRPAAPAPGDMVEEIEVTVTMPLPTPPALRVDDSTTTV